MVICFLNYTGFSVVLKWMITTRYGWDFRNLFGEKDLSLGQTLANTPKSSILNFLHMLKVDTHKTNILGFDPQSEWLVHMPASSIFSSYHILGFSSSRFEDWEEKIFHFVFDLSCSAKCWLHLRKRKTNLRT